MSTSSNALSAFIQQTIAEHQGFISFDRFMELALYHPEWGYYSAENFTLGKQGDFTTAPEISPLFAQCLARQCAQILNTLESGSILELGAGTGRLAGDLLDALQKSNALPAHYYIYEISEHLRNKQQAFIEAHYPQWSSRITWLDTLPCDLEAVVIANEVLDALPVKCFKIDQSMEPLEKVVTYNGEQFTWDTMKSTSFEFERAVKHLQETYHLQPGYESELNLKLPQLMASLSKSIQKGAIFLIDYGYGQREYYHPERNRGTLTCFYQHQRHADPFILPGLQDMTAHVDFTSVAEYAFDSGLEVAGFTTQAAFLLACGLLEIAEEDEKTLSTIDAFKMHQSIKTLTLPTEMGDRIKVMALHKNLNVKLMGLSLHDRRRDL